MSDTMRQKLLLALAAALLATVSIRAGAASLSGLTPGWVPTGPCAPGASYDPACDVDHDGDVDIFDIQLAAGHWNQNGAWTGGDFWSLTGNAGTTAGTHFLGTTDMEALELHVAGQRALRLEPISVPPDQVQGGGSTPNLMGGHADNAVTPYVKGATIGGGGAEGQGHQVFDDFGTVGGGVRNWAGDNTGTLDDRPWATVGGGVYNWASGKAATVSGGSDNSASGYVATVGGGLYNIASASYTTVGGGLDNLASDAGAAVGGGFDNTANKPYAMVGGGQGNHAVGDFAVVSGGYANTASGESATVAGGVWNIASGQNATAAGGTRNASSGADAMTAGGSMNTASGDTSFAAGHRAWANHTGAFVWADSTNADFASTAANQFLMRAAGGVGINTNAPNAALAVDGGNSVARIAVNSNSPTANAGLNLRQDGVGRWSIATVSADGDLTFFREGAGGGSRLFVDGGGANAGYVGIGSAAPQYPLHMASGAYVTTGGVWTNASSRALKIGFADVDRMALLEALVALPITSWSYRAEDNPALRHLGPTAEDFYAAFGLGQDGTTIGTVDADGVALATIQALYQLLQAQQTQLAAQHARISALEAQLAAMMPALPGETQFGGNEWSSTNGNNERTDTTQHSGLTWIHGGER